MALALALMVAPLCRADVTATYNSATDVPVTADGFLAAGQAFSAVLNFAPPTGTNLMVVKNTGLSFINGTFSNLTQGQVVTLGYGGINYLFIANYYGGSGNDLVLQWAWTKPVAWGYNEYGGVGDNSKVNRLVPVEVVSTGVLAGKAIIAQAAGSAHSVALCSDGTVAAWGINWTDGQLGNNSRTDSSVPVEVDKTGVLSGKAVVAVRAGSGHSLALCSDGTVAAWGRNDEGQLGNNANTDSSVPVAVNTAGVLAGKTIVAVSAGNLHSLALCSDGTVVAWGQNFFGQLGNNSTTNSSVPVAINTAGVLSGKAVIAIAAGGTHSLALCSDGTIAVWGSVSNSTIRTVPVLANTAGPLLGKTVVSLAAGGGPGFSHRVALCSDGTVAEWGDNMLAESVLKSNAGSLAGKTVVAVGAGASHSLAWCSDGTLAAWIADWWGDNSSGQLGNNSTASSLVPVAVSGNPLAGGERYAAASSGASANHSLSLIASPPPSPTVKSSATTNLAKASASLSGTINPNGNATTAQFEYGTTTNYGSVAIVTLAPSDGHTVQNVSADIAGLLPGNTYHYRLTATNALGMSSTSDSTFTTSIDVAATFNSVSDVAVTAIDFSARQATFSATLNFAPPTGATLMVVNNTGPNLIGRFDNLAQGQSVILTYGGINYRFIANYYGGSGNDLVLLWAGARLVAWGDNIDGQLGDNSGADRRVPTNVFSTGALAGKTAISAAAGRLHTLALCSDGTVVAWGDNYLGQLGINSNTNSQVPVAVNTTGVLSGRSAVAVAAGEQHSLALCSDGTIAAWGNNGGGQLGNNSTTTSLVPVAANTAGVLSGKTVVAVAAGSMHSLALCSDGTLAAWGLNSSGQLGNNSAANSSLPVAVDTSGVLSGKAIVAVRAGSSRSLVLCSDGTLVEWGSGNSVPVVVNTGGALSGKTVVAIAVGYSHALALCSDGTIAGWGGNSHGELGNNSTTTSSVPVAVNTAGALSGKTVVAIAAGGYHNVARCSDGTAVAWGYNPSGQLGNNSITNSLVPVPVGGTLTDGECFADTFSGPIAWHNFARIAAPPFPGVSNLAVANITKTGATLIGAVNPNGSIATAQFEYGTTASYGSSVSLTLSPNDNLAAQDVTANLAGLTPGTTYHYRLTATNALTTVATVEGTFTTAIDIAATFNSAADIPFAANEVRAAGGTFSATLNFAPRAGTDLMVVKNTGAAFIIGTFNNLAQGQIVTLSNGGINYRFIANYYGGSGNDLVLRWANKRPVAWGLNSNGQLGDSSTTNRLVPVSVLSTGALAGKIVASAAAGQAHSLALCSDGTLTSWGLNSSGQLGNNSLTQRTAPVAVNTSGFLSGKTVVAVAAGGAHSLAVCSDGTLAAWGLNSNGQVGDTSTTNRLTPVSVFSTGLLANKATVAIAAGQAHNLALCSDGTLAAWGYNAFGQLGNNSTTQSTVPVAVNMTGVLAGKTIAAVASGSYHNVALCSDGTVACWGYNASGQLGNGDVTTSKVPVAVNLTGALSGKTIVAVAAGSSHSLALCSDGTVATWGDNTSGQLGNNSTTNSLLPIAVNTAGVLSGRTVVAVAAGSAYSVALCSDGTLVAWGKNNNGQLGDNSGTQSSVPVAVSSSPLATGERYVALFGCPTANHNICAIASPPQPVVTTLEATNISGGGVTLNALVNAAGGSATVSFDYGLTTAYGATLTATGTVTGSSENAVSATLTSLAPNTMYHFRVSAANAGGAAQGADLTFTTPPDTTGPIGGTMTLTPASPVDAGATLNVAFANWTDPSMPLTYSVMIDDVVVSPQGASASRNVISPAVAGVHTLKALIYDGLANTTEVTQTFTVNTAQETWRKFYFGRVADAGDAADLADPDGDGMNNLFEYLAGTAPTSALSRFTVRLQAVTGQSGQMALIFGPLTAGRTYTVKYKANLTDATWTLLTDTTTIDEGSERTVTDLSPGGSARFYHVEITMP